MSAAAPGKQEGRFSGVGEIEIFWRCWAPSGPPRGLVVIAHGAGEHSGRYDHVGRRFAETGLLVYALDHRGHGHSGGPRALIDRMAAAVADLDALVQQAAGRHPGVPLYLLGHSMGGTVAVSYALAHQDRLAGLILSGPLAALDAAPAPMRLIARALSAVAPRAPLIAVDPQGVSRDPEVVSAYVADPLVHHGKLPARTVVELADAIESFPEDARHITVPTLIIYGTADVLCPPAGSQMLEASLGSADKTLRPYEGLHHEVFNEPERDAVLGDVIAWIEQRLPARA